MWPPKEIQFFAGRRRELVDDAVCRAVLRLLRERTSAKLIVTDTDPHQPDQARTPNLNFSRHLDAFDVAFRNANAPPFATYDVPGGGNMFDRYLLSGVFQDADEVVSVAKMKNHLFMQRI